MTATHREASVRRAPLPFRPGVAAAAALVLLMACAPGTDDPAPEPNTTGRALVAAAHVCADSNQSGVCDPEEPSARTGADGSFVLPGAFASDAVLLVEAEAGVSTDADTGEPVAQGFTLAAPARYRHLITPFATLAFDLPDRLGQAPEAALRSAFQIPGTVPVLAEAPLAGRPRLAGFSRIVTALYARAFAEARDRGESPGEARRSAAGQTLDAASALAEYFAATLGLEPPPPPNSAESPTLDELLAAAGKGIALRDLPGGPGSFGAAYDEVSRHILPGTQCVDPVFANLERTCRNQWSFRLEVLSSIDEVVKNIRGSLGVKADVIVATASGTLSLSEYRRRYTESAHVYLEATLSRCNYGLTGALQSGYEGLYSADYDRFVATCGNRFLSDITTGGRFIGTFDKKFTSTDDIEEFKLQLKAKVFGCTVFNKTWRQRTNDAFRDLDMSVQIVSTDGSVSLQNGTLETLTQRVEEFHDTVRADACGDEDAYLTCAYTGSFADYATATWLPRDPRASFEQLRQNYYLWQTARAAYQAALDRAADVVSHPDRYNLAGSTDPFFDLRIEEAGEEAPAPTAPLALADVEAWVNTGTRDLGSIEGTLATCETNLSSCTSTPTAAGFLSWMDLLQYLPTRKVFVHADCAELSYQYGYVTDGPYTAYYGGDFLKPYPAECRAMETAEPQTYLLLPNTSADAGNLAANYSVRVDGEGAQTTRLVRALRLYPAPSGGTYRLQAFVPTREPFVTSTLANDVREPPLVAAACDGSTVSANLDVTGTPFRFAATVFGQVVDETGAPLEATAAEDGKRLEVVAVGIEGGCISAALVPPTDGIDLEYAP